MASVNIDISTETMIPELEGKPICVKPGIVQYENFLVSVCLSLDMRYSVELELAEKFHFTTIKPYSIQVKLSDMGSSAVELYIAKSAYTIRHSEKKSSS